jgi:signal transduction histidine kinase
VTNTNPGLTGAQVAESFSPFWRADPNASGHRGNAGIGLALCRRIAETLGGRIRGSLTPEGLVSYCLEVPVMLPPPGTEAPATRRFRDSHPVA